MSWPACNPDQNPIEYFWAILAQCSFNNNRQFTCTNDPKKALVFAWDSIDDTILQSLVKSMSDLLLAVMD